MRKLIDTPNAGGITAAYPDGSIVDQTGETTGTALTDILYGDLIQMMHKLKRLAAITENNLPDNEANGFQLLDALFANTVPQWTPPSYKVDYSKTRFVSHNNGMYYHKTALNTTNPPVYDTTNWALVFYWNGSKIVFSDEARIYDIEQFCIAVNNELNSIKSVNTSQNWRLDGIDDKLLTYDDLLYTSTQSITGATTGISSRQITFERKGNIVCVNGYFVASGTALTSDIIAQVSTDFYPKSIINPISATDINVCQLILMTDGKLKYRNNTPPLLISNQLNFSYFV